MTASIACACLWAIVANVLALLPSKHGHWPAAFGLIATGVPLLGWLTLQNGPWIGLIAFGAGASLLRWPLYHLARWARRQPMFGRRPASE